MFIVFSFFQDRSLTAGEREGSFGPPSHDSLIYVLISCFLMFLVVLWGCFGVFFIES